MLTGSVDQFVLNYYCIHNRLVLNEDFNLASITVDLLGLNILLENRAARGTSSSMASLQWVMSMW